MTYYHTGRRAIISSILFPVPEHTGTFYFLLARLGSCDQFWPKKTRTEEYMPLVALPLKNILNSIRASLALPQCSVATGLRFWHYRMEGVWVSESPLGREPPRRATKVALTVACGRNELTCETEIVIVTSIYGSNIETGTRSGVLT